MLSKLSFRDIHKLGGPLATRYGVDKVQPARPLLPKTEGYYTTSLERIVCHAHSSACDSTMFNLVERRFSMDPLFNQNLDRNKYGIYVMYLLLFIQRATIHVWGVFALYVTKKIFNKENM